MVTVAGKQQEGKKYVSPSADCIEQSASWPTPSHVLVILAETRLSRESSNTSFGQLCSVMWRTIVANVLKRQIMLKPFTLLVDDE